MGIAHIFIVISSKNSNTINFHSMYFTYIINSFIIIIELCVLHMNDSKEDLNANKEQHEHIGLGKIGNIGFKEILKINLFKKFLL